MRLSIVIFGDAFLLASGIISYRLNRERLGTADAILTGVCAAIIGFVNPSFLLSGSFAPYSYGAQPITALLVIVVFYLVVSALKQRYGKKLPYLITTCLSLLVFATEVVPLVFGLIFFF